jgi:hypothetical protein
VRALCGGPPRAKPNKAAPAGFAYVPCLLHIHPLSRYLHIVAARIVSVDQHRDRRPRKILVAWSVSQILATKRVHSSRLRICPLGHQPPVIAVHWHVVDARARLAALMHDIGDRRSHTCTAAAQLGDLPLRKNTCTNPTPTTISANTKNN